MINFLIGASLSALFGQLKILQLIIYTMGFNLVFPINLVEVNTMFLGVATFDLLPSTEIINGISTVTETEAPNSRLEALGLESQNFMINGGTLFIFFAIWVCFNILQLPFALASRFTANNSCLNRFSSRFADKLRWNFFFDVTLTGQVEFMLAALIHLNHWKWDLIGDRLGCIFAILMLVLYLMMPYILFRILRKARQEKTFDKPEFKKRYGGLT